MKLSLASLVITPLRGSLVAVLLVAACQDDDPETNADASTAGDPTGMDPSGPLPDLGADPPRADLGVDPPAACDGYCGALASCLGQSETDCLFQCNADHTDAAAVSSTCAGDHETLLACVAALECDDVSAYLEGQGDYPCAAEDGTRLASCNVVDVPPTCVDFCATSSSCTDTGAQQCEVVCSEAFEAATAVGDDCRASHEAAFTCAAALSCEEFDAWSRAEGDYACQTEDEQLLQACEPN
jgi:hypothetical protein